MKITRSIFLIGIFLTAFIDINAQSFLKAEGTQIVDGTGKPFLLRGMGLGGWMLQEGYMLQIQQNGMQHAIKKRITDLIGEEECDRFYDLWLQNHTTRADIDFLAKAGFNSIRLPMHYNLFTLPVEEEPVPGQNTWIDRGFSMTDSLLAWCKANNMYLILDLHAAPGGQGNDANISDYDSSKPSLWESDANKKKTIDLWRKLAQRYANESAIGGYDLINEPNWSFEGKNKNGVADSMSAPMWQLYREITAAIREVDKNHIIFVEGNGWGNNFRGFPGKWDDNMVLSFHKYWNANSHGSIKWFLELSAKHNVPLWLGESGENSNKWFTDCITLVEKNGIGWAWWPLKKIGSVICPLTIVPPDGYADLVRYWNHQTDVKPSTAEAHRILFQLAENLKFKKCEYNPGIFDAMFRQQKDKSSVEYKKHQTPGSIRAVDYDMGYYGVAYADNDNENIKESGKQYGNKGKLYRNDGVDIGLSDDPSSANQYVVNLFEKGEWLQYTTATTRSKTFKAYAYMKSSQDNGQIRLVVNGDSKPVSMPSMPVCTNAAWQNVYLGDVKLKKGKNTLRIHVEEGEYELLSIELK